MPDIETQLRRYADAVETTYGPPAVSEVVASPLEERSSARRLSDRRRYAPMLTAAAILIAVAGIGTWTTRDQTTEIISPAITTTPTASATPATSNASNAERPVGHPELLPSPESWVLTSATLTEGQATSGESSEMPQAEALQPDVLAFEHSDGRLSILAVGPLSADPSSGERQPLAGADVERQYNRAVMSWTDDFAQLALMTFDVDEQQLRTDASQLVRSGDSYELPGTVILTDGDGEPSSIDQQSTMVFSALSNGEPDRASSIEQTTAPGAINELFRTLFDASDLGTMNRLEVDGNQIYLMTSEFDQYGLTYIDGQIITWQGSTAQVDLNGFVSSLATATTGELASAVEGAEQLRLAAVDKALAETPTDLSSSDSNSNSNSLARFALTAPWQVETVYDRSLWTDEQRAEYEVTVDSMTSQGQVETGRIWYQYFAASEAPDDGLVILEAREATLSPATITVGSPTDRPITVLGYEGNLGEFDGVRLISVRKGTTSVEISSGRLTADELVAFAERLVDRSGDGLTGFDLSDDEFTSLAEGAAPPYEEETERVEPRSYNQQWTLDDMQVRVSVREIIATEANAWPPPEFGQARRSALGTSAPTPALVEGTSFTAEQFATQERLSWLNESAGVTITIDGEPAHTRQAAKSIQAVSEAQWNKLAQPAAFSFEDAMSQLLNPTPPSLSNE